MILFGTVQWSDILNMSWHLSQQAIHADSLGIFSEDSLGEQIRA